MNTLTDRAGRLFSENLFQGVHKMKKALIAMAVMFLIVVYPGGGLWSLLANMIGGGASETFLYPIYGGIILIAGLIVGCTSVILDEIRSLREELNKTRSERE